MLLVISQNCQTVLAQYYRLFIMFREMFQMKNSLSCTQCIIIPSWYFHDTMYTALPLGTYFQIFSNTQTTQYNYSQCWYTRVGWWISKVCADRVILKHLYIETTVQKDFSHKSIFARGITYEKLQKKEKLWFSHKQANILKSCRSWTPNIFFSKSC